LSDGIKGARLKQFLSSSKGLPDFGFLPLVDISLGLAKGFIIP
jgi:hypothetical protein